MKKTSFKTYLKESVHPDTYELREIVRFYPKKHKEVIKHFWGSHKLTYKGQPFFAPASGSAADESSSGMGPVYKGAEAAAQAYIRTDKIDVSHNYDIETTADEVQECYMGYDAHTDQIAIGYDMWLSDEIVENALEDYWRQEHGPQAPANARKQIRPELTEEQEEEMYTFLREEKKQISMMWGGLYFLKSTDGKRYTVTNSIVKPGGYYRGIHGKHDTGLLDLRLD